MFKLSKSQAYSIGIDAGDDNLKLVQLGENGKGISLFAGKSENLPEGVKAGTSQWQRWAIEATAKSIAHGQFQGKVVITAQPPSEVFVNTIKMPKVGKGQLQDIILNHLKSNFNSTPDNTLIQYIKTDNENILGIACDKEKLDRHLAIYEKTRLKVTALSVWPIAVHRAYTHLWARPSGQDDNPVILLDIGKNYTNVVICDNSNVYFAYSSPVGAKKLEIERMVDLLNSEMDMCRVKFKSTFRRFQINKIIFVSGHAIDKDIYTKIAKRAQMSALIGDCLDAVGAARCDQVALKNHTPCTSWITAMGLSLS